MDPVEISVLGLPGVVGLWIVTLAAFGVFGWRAWRLIGLLRRGRPENRLDHPWQRLLLVARNVLLQPRLFNERSIGWAHLVTFWGFMVYATCFAWALVRGLIPALPVPYPDEVPVASLFLEIFAVLVLVALGAALARRLFYPPPHLHLSWDANLILGLIALLMVTMLGGSAMRVLSGAPDVAWHPVGRLIAAGLPATAARTVEAWSAGFWWVHMLTVLFFTVYLPFSKHLHLLASPFNVFFGNLRPAGDLGVAGVAEGAGRWEDFTWKQLLSGYSCAECGRCDRACPALASGLPIEPQQLVQKIKRHMLETGLARAGANGANGHAPNADASAGGANGARDSTLIGDVISPDEIWSCTTCLACVERCAVWNEHLSLLIQMRRHLVGEGAIAQTVQDALANLTRYGNSFGKSERLRAKWTQTAGFKIKDARKEPVDWLWFVGDYASYDPRLETATKRTAMVFAEAGLDFGILYDGERNAGNDVRRVGEEGLFEMLREKNQAVLAKAKFRRIVTTDPHTYNTLKHEYAWNGSGVTVHHYTEVFDELLQTGRLPVQRKLSGRVTYHDPCYLGRYNGVYEAPRRVLRGLGFEVVEMPRTRNRSHCCGAGGGRIWMEDTPNVKERPAESRVREAAALPGVNTLVVACPKDIAMFRDAVKTTGLEGRLAVVDLAELVGEALEPAKEQAA